MATHQEAQSAIYDTVVELAEVAKAWKDPRGAKMIRDVAIAFRAAAGGPQAGVFVEGGE